ncbi:MAG: DUF721 domain-containing protein [Prevotellaceae bacterium]|jgi:predicted nucleic acid-binding Zn ribbon protein|nr:DUF721 domain-containing protein [Prevotellaceae bacterium]
MIRKQPVALNSLLLSIVKEKRLEEGFRQYRFFKLWDEITGQHIAKVTTYKRLDGKKLYISLASSVVRSELYMHRSEIIAELNRRTGENIIDEIILK